MDSETEFASRSPLGALTAERLLIDSLPRMWDKLGFPAEHQSTSQCLVISPGRAQAAWQLARMGSFESVQAWYVDLHEASLAGSDEETVQILCGADLPEAEYQLVALPILRRAEAEWTRDILQQAHARLATGGILIASVDNPQDRWLHEQLQGMFDKVTCDRQERGCVYWSRKTQTLKKLRDFSCQFAFRDDGRLIQAVSRPGVFSHRRLDAGARQLMLTAEIEEADHVLDMGCGCGSLALAAAFKTKGRVFGVDSNARSIQCLKQGAELNQLTNVEPVWNADGNLEFPVEIDVALANPPYFGENAIAQHFVDTAFHALRPGGALLVVTKQPGWYEAYFQQLLEDVVVFEASKYFVACGRKPLP